MGLRYYYCVSCDFSFSAVVGTGIEPDIIRCPHCHAKRPHPKRVYKKFNNSVKGFILAGGII